MKKTIYSLLAITALLFSSCESFTELEPKGKNLLTTTDQLEMLLNKEYEGCSSDMRQMAGDMIYADNNVATIISQPVKTRNVIIWTYDEANMDKMAELTSSDQDYTNFYGYIGTIANPILSKVDAASGTEADKKLLKSEALTLRAWSFYMLVNKFAKAYNPATAATDPGIILMTEDKDIQTAQPKSTIEEVYQQILKDANEAIEIDGLPNSAVNKMRFSKPAAYAVKALALLNMQKYDEAEEVAKQAIDINGTINNYNTSYLGSTQGYITGGTYPVINRGKKGTDEDYFLNGNLESFNAYTPTTMANFEAGHAYKDKMSNMNMMYDYLMDAGVSMLGETGFNLTFDLNSLWNDGGLRSTQMYLTIAECETHKGNYDTAMEYLDKVRVNRIDPAKYQPLKGTVSTKEEAIKHVKQVTMNEDIYSVNIFIDKKRWNQCDGWKQNYSRTLAGKTYTITPDSKMWIFPFPQSVINNNGNITQNYKE